MACMPPHSRASDCRAAINSAKLATNWWQASLKNLGMHCIQSTILIMKKKSRTTILQKYQTVPVTKTLVTSGQSYDLIQPREQPCKYLLYTNSLEFLETAWK